MDINQIVGQNIRELRRMRRFSQEELAHRAGIDRSYLSELENGLKNIGLSTIAYVAHALSVKVTDLFAGYNDPPQP